MLQVPAGWTVANIGDVTATTQTINPREHPETEFKYVDIGAINSASLTIVNPKVLFGTQTLPQGLDDLFAQVMCFSRRSEHTSGM